MNSKDLLDSVGFWVGHARFDGWENPYTGFGTTRDKTIFSNYMYATALSDNTLEQLYHGDDIAQRMIDTAPEEMLRKGYHLKLGDTDQEAATLEALDELDTNQKLIEAMIWADLYGGAVLVPIAEDGGPAFMPLQIERVRKVESLEVIDRRFVSPHTYYRAGPKRGQPEVYAVGSPGPHVRPEFLIHETRLIPFRGARTSQTEQQRRGGWDVSRLQRPYEVMRSFATGFKAVEVLLTDGPQGVYGIKGLAQLIGAQGQELISARIEAVEKLRSALRAIAIDKDHESFTRAAFSFSGIPDVMDRLMLRLAASVPMPVTMLMGQSPAGMDATGESDLRWYYEKIATRQENYLAPRIRRLVSMLLATQEGPAAGRGARGEGKTAKTIEIEFEALWTLDPKQEAERRQIVANTDKIYFDMGALMPEEIALSRFGERGWQDSYNEVDRDLRQVTLEEAKKKIESGEQPPTTLELLTPSANEAVVTVNEARAAKGFGPDPDPKIGAMKVAEYRAMQEAAAAKLGEHEAAEETGEPTEAELKAKQAEAAKSGSQNGPPQAAQNGPPNAPPTPPGKPPAVPAPPDRGAKKNTPAEE